MASIIDNDTALSYNKGMVSPDRLERYKDFVDPQNTGESYDPRKGLERLMGVLSPDPKGIVLAAMGYEWYGTVSQLQSAVFAWLEELGLSRDLWPLTYTPTWSYCERRDNNREIVDGSLVDLGAVVKKAEDPSQVLYSRSVAGAGLAVPLVQQAVRFVSKAGEYVPHKFDSMWRIIGTVHSSTDQRRPLGIWDVIDFLVHNPGKNSQVHLHNETHISQDRLLKILDSLGNCGVINYISPLIEVAGHRGRGWAIYTLADQQSITDLDPGKVYQDGRAIRGHFTDRSYLTKIIDYIKEHPDSEYERVTLAEKLDISPSSAVSAILSMLTDLGLLKRPDHGFKGGKIQSLASANGLTHLFYDLVCAPAKAVADTLSSLPLRPWSRREVAIYLENYHEERSQVGIQGGEEVRRLLLEILSQEGQEMKLSYIVDLYNDQADREIKGKAIGSQLNMLLQLGEAEQPRLGYYRLVQK